MRRKFKAWDNVLKKWDEPIYEAYQGRLHDLSISHNGRLCEATLDESRNLKIIDESALEDRYTIVHFTGLHDITAKEIYEGDILQNIYGDHPGLVYYEVDEGAYFLAPPQNVDVSAEDYVQLSMYSIEEMKVIGNEFENPELMEVEELVPEKELPLMNFNPSAWQKAQREKRATEPQKVLEDTQGVTIVSDERMAELHDKERKYDQLVANLERFMADPKGERYDQSNHAVSELQ